MNVRCIPRGCLQGEIFMRSLHVSAGVHVCKAAIDGKEGWTGKVMIGK